MVARSESVSLAGDENGEQEHGKHDVTKSFTDEVFPLLGCCAELVGSLFPTFRVNVSVLPSRQAVSPEGGTSPLS